MLHKSPKQLDASFSPQLVRPTPRILQFGGGNFMRGATVSGNGLIRAEVRVFWLRDGQGFAQNMCEAAQAANVGAAPQTFHFVQKITAIRENTL